MKVKFHGDSIDIEHIKQTLESPGFALLQARLHKMHGDKLVGLKTETNVAELRRAQGFLAAIECVQSLPKILCDEIRATQKGNV